MTDISGWKGAERLSCVSLAGLALLSVQAAAQTSPMPEPSPVLPYQYRTDLDGVADRYRPDYEPAGVPVGGFVIRPSLAGDVNYTSNVYGSRSGERSDGFVTVAPSIGITSAGNDDDRYVRVNAGAALRRYFNETLSNENGLSLTGAAGLPLGGGTALTAGGRAERRYERQDSGDFPAASLAPIQYNEFSGFLRLNHQGSRFRVSAAGDATRFSFYDARVANTGARIDQHSRDRTVLRGSGRVEGSFTDAFSAFVEGSFQNIDYARSVIGPGVANRDGEQMDVRGGVLIDTGKLRSAASAGYMRRTYDSSSYGDFGGLSINGKLTYFASGLTTFTLEASRDINESSDPGVKAFFHTRGAARVDHELYRYVILSGEVAYDHNKYSAVDRTDKLFWATASARYLVGRHFEVKADVNYIKRTSDGSLPGPVFNRFQGGIGLVAKF